MNPEAMRIHSRGRFQGGLQVKNEKTRLSLNSLKPENRLEKSKYKPFWGKIFYLDLPSVTISEKLQKDIKDLGGRVEEFLSKDISYLISSKKEAKYAQTLGRISPVPSPESAYTAETTSPHPSHDGSSFKSPDTVYLSRGKLLVEKAIKDHDFIPSNSILSNALSWGVKILHIDDIRYYIEQRKKELCSLKKPGPSERDVGKRVVTGTQKTRRGRLKKPFIKVEDMNQLYRPFYLQFTSIPFINYSTQKPCSPFDVDKPSSIQKQTQVKLRIQMEGHKYGGSSVQLQLKEKKKKGYCECCLQKYEDLETHLLSEQHRSFAQSSQYQVVDDILSKLDFGFVEYERDKPKQKRIKYSIRSFSSVSTNFLKKTEPEEKCELQYICHKDAIEDNGKLMNQNIPLGETEEPEEKLVFLSKSVPCLSDDLRGRFKEKRINECSDLNATENDMKQNFTQLPPSKSKQDCILNISEHKLIVNENDLEDHCPTRLHSCVQVSHFNTDNSVFQPNAKSNVDLFPSKDLKGNDLHPTNPDCDLSAVNTSQECLRIKIKSPPCCSPEEPSARDNSSDDLPSGRIHRKMKIFLEQNKKENLEPNAELDEKTEFLTAQEAKRICTSPVQSLLDLFQTSGEKSEFYGFTGYTENSGICEMLNVWEEESPDTLLSTFFSSPSTSTFIGF